MFRNLQIQIGVHPIIWSNDDFHDLGGTIPLEQCLDEMQATGYRGTELGHKFPRDKGELADTLARHQLQLISGWHSTHLATRPFSQERSAFEAHLDKLWHCGSRLVIVAECSKAWYCRPDRPLGLENGQGLDREAWDRTSRGLEELAILAEDRGMVCVYHHHVGTVIQNAQQVDRLMQETRRLMLLMDTGHLLLVGIDPAQIVREYPDRIKHVHLKNVRARMADRALREEWSFARAVSEGVFTVPGDGGFDFTSVFDALDDAAYHGWMVVEADQDPAKAPPRRYAELARNYIRERTGF